LSQIPWNTQSWNAGSLSRCMAAFFNILNPING